MLDPKTRAELDQAAEGILELYPRLWRRMYLKLVKEGFSEAQALLLVIAFIQKPN